MLVSSAVPDEGKSTTLANLGVINAQAGKRVILLDCDLRRPKLHELLGVGNNAGVSTALLEPDGDLPLQDTEVDNLRVMTAGPLPPNPADLLSSKRMDTLLAQLIQQSDLVLLDAPPVNSATDAALLATKVEGVLLVVSAGHTKRDDAERAKDMLEKVNANVVGAVLTNAAADSSAYGEY